jgi:AcrR family transcriptional regulator
MDTVAVEKWTPERRRQLTRDTLVDAAAVVFARRGFHGASLDEIAETAGFTRGAIYKNFADKEDLFLAVWERFNDRVLNEFGELLGSGQALDTVHVGAVADKWREVQTGDPDFFVLGLEFNLYLVRNPGLRERVQARRHEGAQRVARFMEQQAAAAGAELPMPVEDLANIFLITSDGFTMATLIDPELARLYEPFLELLIQGLVAGPSLAPDPPD